MNILDSLKRALIGEGDAAILDHVPLNTGGSYVDADGNRCTTAKQSPVGEGLSRKEKLALAAQRLGKPFKCAAEGLPRMVIRDSQDVVVGQTPKPVAPAPNVAELGRKGRRA